ncbi:MAG: type IV secretory system conjugative DNA transfer family protein [Candidatus Saccharimonadales bacterium]
MDALIIFSTVLIIILALAGAGFIVYRKGLRFAKGVERGIKMVPILINLPPSSEDVEVGGRDVRDVIQERISQAEVLFNLIASTATKGFKSKFFGQRHLAFEIVAIDGVIRLYTAVPVALVAVIKQAILTAYPGAQLEEVEDHNIFSATGKITGTYGGEIKLKQAYSYPIATVNQLKRDAMQAVIKSLTSLEQGDGASLQILVRPAREGWTKSSEHIVKQKRDDKGSSGISAKSLLQAPFKAPESGDKDSGPKPPKQLTSLEQSMLDAIEEKTKSSGYEVLIRVIASSGTATRAQSITHNVISAFSLFDAPGLNGFKFEPAKSIEKFVTDFIFRFFPPERAKMVLNSVELATLFHLPDDQFTKTTQLQRQFSKQVEGPTRLSKDGVMLGHNSYHGVKKEIRLSDEDRRRHVYIVGQTGTGKTTALSNMMVQDMMDGKGFAFVDPHGDEAERLLGMVPPERSEDVIYFDPGNMDTPMGLNIFEYRTEDQKDFLIQEAINMLYRLYDPQHTGIIGPRYEHLFRNAALTVMADPAGGTFVDIPKLFRDPQFVRQKLKHVTDQSVREFWQKEMPQSQRSNDFGEVVSWFVSKFGAFLSNQLMRNTIGQTKSAFDLRELMDSNKILIANLSKGRLGELNSQLLGMIFVMKFQAAAMSRANVPEDERKDFSLYVDEFQNFSTESFAFILSEARKYRMNLIVANQFISQLSDEIRDAVFGNVGTIISYRTGPADADFLVKQFAPAFNERDLVNLPNFNAAIRLMSGGLPTQPFNIAALPPLASSKPQLAQALKKLSAAKYGRPRAEVEKEIFDRVASQPAPSPFESLATNSRESTGPPLGSGSGPSASPGASGGAASASFLDEWLDKRRATLQQAASQSAPRPQLEPTDHSPKQTSTYADQAAPKSSGVSESAQTQPPAPSESPNLSTPEPISFSSAPASSPPSGDSQTFTPPSPLSFPAPPSAALQQEEDADQSTPKSPDLPELPAQVEGDISTASASSDVEQTDSSVLPLVPAGDEPHVEPAESAATAAQARPESSETAEAGLQQSEAPEANVVQPQPVPPEESTPDDSSEPLVSPFGTGVVMPEQKPLKPEAAESNPTESAVPKLQPGEIYIDDEGKVHQG